MVKENLPMEGENFATLVVVKKNIIGENFELVNRWKRVGGSQEFFFTAFTPQRAFRMIFVGWKTTKLTWSISQLNKDKDMKGQSGNSQVKIESTMLH